MQIVDIIWLPHIADKLAWKHQVVLEEVNEVLFGYPFYRKIQKGYVQDEDVYAALGGTYEGRYPIVVFEYKKTKEALILSVRNMDRKERRRYERR